jgi:hypothetical protein
MPDLFATIFDVTFLATVGLILAATLVGAYARSRRRDVCLKSFEGFHVTVERVNGKTVWGVLRLESTGFELDYRDSVQDANHVESSYLMYADEFGDIRAVYRYADDLTSDNRRRRAKDIENSFHPGPVRRLRRSTRHFMATATESIGEVIGLLVGRLRRPAGRYITATGEAHLKNLGVSVIGNVGHSHDPLLERCIGQKIVVEVLEAGEEVHEHVGILKDYSPDFIQILDVQFPQRQAMRIGSRTRARSSSIDVNVEGTRMFVRNLTEQPVLLQSLSADEVEEPLNVVVDGGEMVELYPEADPRRAKLNMRVVRELDMIIPRTRCVARHRAERHSPDVLPEIIFDLGVVLTGGSRLEHREKRLRDRLEENPYSALSAANLGAVLMQRENLDEAEIWLQRALRMRHSLPDNGRRTQMMLNELRRRQAKEIQVTDWAAFGLTAEMLTPSGAGDGNSD